MDSSRRKTTIHDVARAAEVSAITVSRVLSGNGYASAPTRAAVERAAKKLGYVPNRIASSLASGRTKAIGLVVPNIASVYFAEIALGVENASTPAGYHLIVTNTSGSLEQEKRILDFLHQTRVDGIIMAGARLPNATLVRALAHFPAFVSINHPISSRRGGIIVSEQAKGMAMAVEHLVRGHRRVIAFMAGPQNSYTAAERLRGYRAAMERFDLPVRPELIVPYEINYGEEYHSDWEWFDSADVGSAEWNERRATLGSRGAHALLSQQREVDAIVCFDDQLAFGVLQACARLGRRVPDDVAVIGCNDIPLAIQVTPTLTTQRIPRYRIGKRAVEMLIEQLNGERPREPAIFPHELIVRESAPAAT
ncbi:MAG: LacI family transcriptional regulator [Chloroflexi bacterium]|nr:LacI family transcriptional regulator [Chloroflexota bacterium]